MHIAWVSISQWEIPGVMFSWWRSQSQISLFYTVGHWGKCALESLNGFHSSAGESLWWHGVRVYSGNKLSQSSPRKSKDSVSFGRVIKLDGASSILTNLDYDEWVLETCSSVGIVYVWTECEVLWGVVVERKLGQFKTTITTRRRTTRSNFQRCKTFGKVSVGRARHRTSLCPPFSVDCVTE